MLRYASIKSKLLSALADFRINLEFYEPDTYEDDETDLLAIYDLIRKYEKKINDQNLPTTEEKMPDITNSYMSSKQEKMPDITNLYMSSKQEKMKLGNLFRISSNLTPPRTTTQEGMFICTECKKEYSIDTNEHSLNCCEKRLRLCGHCCDIVIHEFEDKCQKAKRRLYTLKCHACSDGNLLKQILDFQKTSATCPEPFKRLVTVFADIHRRRICIGHCSEDHVEALATLIKWLNNNGVSKDYDKASKKSKGEKRSRAKKCIDSLTTFSDRADEVPEGKRLKIKIAPQFHMPYDKEGTGPNPVYKQNILPITH